MAVLSVHEPTTEICSVPQMSSNIQTSQRRAKQKHIAARMKWEKSDENHTLSKLGEAMENPDWRKRDESTVVRPSLKYTTKNLLSLRVQPGRKNLKSLSRDSTRGASDGSTSSSATFLEAYGESEDGPEYTKTNPTETDPTRLKMKDVTCQGNLARCTVIKRQELSISRPGGKAISLIEIVPLHLQGASGRSSEQQNSRSTEGNIAQIQRVRVNSEKKIHTVQQCHIKELAAALNSAQADSVVDTQDLKSKCDLKQAPTQLFGNATKNNDAVTRYIDMNTRRHIGSNESSLPFHSSTDVDASISHGGDRAAFQKILGKLNKTKSSEVYVDPESRDSGYYESTLAIPMPVPMPSLTHPASTRRWCPREPKPTGQTNRSRKSVTASDFGISYWPGSRASRKTYESSDSDVVIDLPTKFNTLNPKAREFLSFTDEKGSPDALEYANSTAAPRNRLKSNVVDSSYKMYNSGAACQARTFPDAHISLRSGGLANYCFDGLSLPNFCGAPPASCIPLNSQQFMSTGQFLPHFGLPSAAYVGATALPLPINLFGYPRVIPGSLSTPSLVGSQSLPDPIASLPPGVPRQNGFKVGPTPVQKPRIPDPTSQQEYEAWIEWRKTNEPGYAMECKLRQQRRSQRASATTSKDK